MILVYSLLTIFLLFVLIFSVVLRHPVFGKTATGTRKSRLESSINFKNGIFHNQNLTPDFSEGVTYGKVIRQGMLKRHPHRYPSSTIPSVKTDLQSLTLNKNQFIWFGHSSYLLVVDGKKILVDPVFSGHASPFPSMIRSFEGADVYQAKDMPDIDILLITHDHYDHLDYKTMVALFPKVKKVVTTLGVGAHLEHWGCNHKLIHELAWNESLKVEGLEVMALPTRHFSGRSHQRKTTLWASFMILGTEKIYVGSDSGYDDHFKKIGETYGPIDVAILECGQYSPLWSYIHMTPEETVQAGKDLKAQYTIPVHWGKFALSQHTWKDPIERFVLAANQNKLPYHTGQIGQIIYWTGHTKPNEWWSTID